MTAVPLIERGRINRRTNRVWSADFPVFARPVGTQHKKAFHCADKQKNVAICGGNMMDGRQRLPPESTSCAEIILDAERQIGLETVSLLLLVGLRVLERHPRPSQAGWARPWVRPGRRCPFLQSAGHRLGLQFSSAVFFQTWRAVFPCVPVPSALLQM